MKVDSCVHAWSEDASAFPTHPDHPLPPPPLSSIGSPANLLASMDAAGVSACLVVQPINYMHDLSFLVKVASDAPSRLFPVALAPLAASPDAARLDVVRSVQDLSCVGVRINPMLSGARGDTTNAVMQAAGELGVPVNLFTRGMSNVEELVAAHPNTHVVIDHLAFCRPIESDKDLLRLLSLGRTYSNVSVKASAFFRVSGDPYPYKDMHPTVLSVVEAFGAARVLGGTDWPFVTEHSSYADAWAVFDSIPLSEDDRKMICGAATVRLYKLNVV
jgi:predicted TIM-barrel fold metal-dependent hydrolase